ncbi:MAG: 2-C-methyl-D-erythritol 4-phosphate cytidylyltransferase [Pseudomonadota bacterium]
MPAAGSGQRFGGAIPKQYLQLAGRSVIAWSLGTFLDDPRCAGISVAVAMDDPYWPAIRAGLADRRLKDCRGGAERCDSVLAALDDSSAGEDDWVLVHDAARPCLGREELDALLAAAGTHAVGGLLAIPLADTLKRADEAGVAVSDTPSRSGLWRALTPQMFRKGPLAAALRAARALGRVPTDESQAMEWQGHAPRLVPGEALNIKVTRPADLVFAAAVLASRGVQA